MSGNGSIPVISRDLAAWLMASHVVKPVSLRPASPAQLPPQLREQHNSGQWLQVDVNGVASLLQGAGFVDVLSSFVRPPGYKSGAVYSNTPHARATNWTLVQRLLTDDMGLAHLATEDDREAWLCGEVEAILTLADRLRMAIPGVQANLRRAGGVKSHPAPKTEQPQRRGAGAGRTPEPRKQARLAPINHQPSLPPPPPTDPGVVAQQVTQLATLLLHQQQLHLALQQQQRALHAHEQAQFYQLAFHQQPAQTLPPLMQPAVFPPPGVMPMPMMAYPPPQPMTMQHQHGFPAAGPNPTTMFQHHHAQDPVSSSPHSSQQQQQQQLLQRRQPPPPVEGVWTPVSVCRLESAELRREGLPPVPLSRGSLSSSSSLAVSPQDIRMAPRPLAGPDDSDDEPADSRRRPKRLSGAGSTPTGGQHLQAATPSHNQRQTEDHHASSSTPGSDVPLRQRFDVDSRAGAATAPWLSSIPRNCGPALSGDDGAALDTLRRRVTHWWREAHFVVERTAFLLWLRWTLPRALSRRQRDAEALLQEAPPAVQRAKGNRKMNTRTAKIVEEIAMQRKRQRRHLILAGQHILRMANVKLGLVAFRKWVSWHLLVRDQRPLLVPHCAVITPRGAPNVAPLEAHETRHLEEDAGDTHAFDAIAEARQGDVPPPGPRQCPSCATTTEDAAAKWCGVCGEPLERIAPLPTDVRREDHWRLTLEYGRLDMISRFDRRAPAVSIATQVLQKVMRGLVAERFVFHTVASRVFTSSATVRSQMAVRFFVVMFIGKLVSRRKCRLVGRRRPLELLPMHAEMSIAALRRQLKDAALPSRTLMLLPSACATVASTPHATLGCVCGRCLLVVSLLTRQLYRRTYTDLPARADEGDQDGADDTATAISSRSKRSLALEDRLQRTTRIYATPLCPLGRRRRSAHAVLSRHARSALTTLRSVALVCVAVVKLLQRPWPVGWYDARLARSQCVFDEANARSEVESQWLASLADAVTTGDPPLLTVGAARAAGLPATALQADDDAERRNSSTITPGVVAAEPRQPEVADDEEGEPRPRLGRRLQRGVPVTFSDPLESECWWFARDDPVAEPAYLHCPAPPPPSTAASEGSMAGLLTTPPSRAATVATDRASHVRSAVGTPLGAGGYHDPPPSSAASSAYADASTVDGRRSRVGSVASTASTVNQSGPLRRVPLSSTPLDHGVAPPGTPSAMSDPSQPPPPALEL